MGKWEQSIEIEQEEAQEGDEYVREISIKQQLVCRGKLN